MGVERLRVFEYFMFIAGKIFGIESNYYIAEAQFKEGADPVIEEEQEDETSFQQVSLCNL